MIFGFAVTTLFMWRRLSLGYRQNRAALFRSLFLCFRYLYYFSFLSVVDPHFGDFWLFCFRLYVTSWSFCGLSIGGYRQCLGLGFQRMIGLFLPSSLFSILQSLPRALGVATACFTGILLVTHCAVVCPVHPGGSFVLLAQNLYPHSSSGTPGPYL
jgi:hypothetical protein